MSTHSKVIARTDTQTLPKHYLIEFAGVNIFNCQNLGGNQII